MDHTIHNACKSEAASDDGAHANQELKEVLSHIWVLNSEGRDLIIENDQALVALILCLTRRGQLEHFVFVKKFWA